MSIFDKIKEPTGIELIDTMFDPYLRGEGILADTVRGFYSGEERLKNIQKYNTTERLLDKYTKKEEQIDRMLANEYGPATFDSAQFIQDSMEKQGVTSPYDVDIGSEYDRYVRQVKDTKGLVLAEQLTTDSKYDVFAKATAMGVADAGLFIASMLDGYGGDLQFERMSNAVRNNKYVDLKYAINKENLASLLGKPVEELTTKDLEDAEAQVYALHNMSHLGYGVGTIGSFPAEDVLLRGAFAAFVQGGKLAFNNPKTTAAIAGAAVTGQTTDAEARQKVIQYANDLKPGDDLAKQSEVDQMVADYIAGRTKTDKTNTTPTKPVVEGETTTIKTRAPGGGPYIKTEVSTELLDKAAEMYRGEGVRWSDLSNGEKTHLFDSRGIGPKIDIEQGIINPKWKPITNNPVYGGTRDVDIAYSKELDKAAAYVSNGERTYGEFLTEAQRKERGLGRNNTETQAYLRKEYIRKNKFVGPASEGKQSNIKAVRDALEEKLKRRAEAFYEQHDRYPTQAELHFNTFGYAVRDAKDPNLNLVDHSKLIRKLEDDGIIILSKEDEVRIVKKVEEEDNFQRGIPAFENQYNTVAEVISRKTGIPKDRVTDFFHRGHSLREDYFNRVPVELQEQVLRPNQLLTSGQNARHVHYEDTIIDMYNLKEEAMGYLNQILRAEQTLSKTQLAALDDLVETFGIGIKENANNLQKAQAVLKGIQKNLDQIDNQMLEEGIYTPMYDPVTGKARTFGQPAGGGFDPLDPKRPRSDQTKVPPNISSQKATAADVMSAARRLEEKMKSVDPETGLPTATDQYGRALSGGGDPEKAPLKRRVFGNEGGDEEDLKRKGVFAQYLDFKDDKAGIQLGLESMPESQQKQMAFFLADPIEGQQRIERERVADASVRYKVIPKDDSVSSVQQKIAEKLIDKKPTKFPLTSFPKLLTENALVKSFQRNMATGPLIFGQVANSILNSMGGDEKTFAERFPVLSEYLAKGFEPTPATPKEAAYIDGIDEINRAIETGFRNLGFNTMDLVLGGIDLTGFGDGKLSERLRQSYEKTAKNDPETFLGDMVALLVEFGVPGGLVSKLVTRMQKALRLKGLNTMTRYVDDDVVGTARLAMNTSNIAKRMGTGAVIFGAADFVGGGPYSSLKRMFPEDATLLPGKPIDTTDLSGPELALANMKNRVRFGADGALIGGLFPLVGPPAWALTKGTLALPFKTLPGINRSVFGGALQLAGVPLKIAADSLAGKIPYTNKTIPLVGEGISYLGKQGATAAQATAAFIGKQVFTRAALGLYDAAYARSGIYAGMRPKTTMFTKNLPKFEDWRRFSVNSRDPLHQYLARIDNKLAMFRDIGKLGKDAFAIKTQSDLYIRAKSRAVEKYLIDVERIAYKLAKAFEERHQKYGEFETIQKKYLDDVLDFLEGKIRVDQLPKQLQVPANDLRNYTNSLKKEFGELLPTTDPINYLLQADINSVMRRSFAAFTNNSYQPTKEAVRNAKEFIKDLIQNNNSLKMEAEMAFPDRSIAEAIDEFASLKVADIMHTARYEMSDPFKALENIAFRKLGLDDISLVTGDELPKAIRALLGEEKNLRSSLLQTTGNIIASTSQKKALDQIAQMGLANGWLFRSADEALGKGILNAAPLTDVKGSGFLLNDAIGLYGTPEIIKQLGGYSLFDGFLKSTIYQNILAAKAMVQGGKTLYSPATQMRNVGSAALFALNVGHIGGSASVPQAFKIVMDDIFGPGRNVDKKALNKFIERKIELGVIDENVVAQELTAILNDLKGATKETGEPVISSFNQLIQRVGNTQLSQYVQRLYAGGDNLWKLYGHEFYISELKQFTKSIDDVQRYFRDIVGREFVEISPKTGGKKTVMEGIEEIAAHLVRDTYPTYSRVPPAIQAIRKLPIGNFISFPAEMLRTTATTLSTSLKHIASGNPGLQAMGYRSLFGQFTTLYGVNEGVKALGHTFTDVSPEAMRAYQDGLGPKFMENHLMVPLTNKDPQTGEFKAFDLSSYNPYAYVIDPVESFIRELGTTRMSVDEVEGEVYNRIFDAASPLMAFIEPFTSETILLEPMFDIWARQGRARNGATVFSPTDDFGDKVSKSFRHIIGTVAPGFIRSSGQVLNALSLDTKQGRLSELGDVMLRLMGGSIINVDPVSALDYKAIDIRDIRSNVYKTEHFFSKENALERGPDVMAAEFQQIQNEALAAQFEVYKMFAESLESGLLTRDQIEQVLGKDGRNVPNLDNLMDGYFTPVSYSESGLEQRADELYKEYLKSGIVINRSDLLPLSKLDSIIFKMENIRFKDLVDPDRKPLAKPKSSSDNLYFGDQQQDPVTPELPNMPTPVVPNTDINPVNPATGLTTTETALLSPGEQAIRQRQKGMA